MTDGGKRDAECQALDELERRIATGATAADHFQRAGMLVRLGRDDQARGAYLEALRLDDRHFGALNDFGTLLHRTGYRSAACTAYQRAVALHPDQPMVRVNLGNVLMEMGDVTGARAQYEAALSVDPAHREAHQGMAMVFDELSDEVAAESHRRLAFQGRALTERRHRGSAAPIPAVLLVSARGGNIPTNILLDDAIFHTTAVVAEYAAPGMALPAESLVFNAIGDADRSRAALTAAERLLAGRSAAVINPPARVLSTGRAENARRLTGLPGVIVPKTTDFARTILENSEGPNALSASGFGFPLLLRSRGFHTGRHFVRVGDPNELARAAAGLPGAELTAIELLNPRGVDGKFRKYRAMVIDQKIYPLHLAVASDWKVHYFTADMAENPGHRAEEARFLRDIAAVIGKTALAALSRIATMLRLDYMGVDFALAPSGDLLLFEANATMVVNPPQPEERWAYRKPAIDDVLAAVRTMLLTRAPSRA